MAMAEAHLGATYNKDGLNVIDHLHCNLRRRRPSEGSPTKRLPGGPLKLGKLVMLYDSNNISLDGELSLSFSENVQQRFEGYGWQVLRVEDGNDLDALAEAVKQAQAETGKPTLIEVKTTIGYGSPNKGGKGGHGGTHGSPLGAEETVLTKKFYGWESGAILRAGRSPRSFRRHQEKGRASQRGLGRDVCCLKAAHPELAAQFERSAKGELPKAGTRICRLTPQATRRYRLA